MEIGSITTENKEEARIKMILEEHIFDFLIESSKLEEFEETVISPKYLDKKIKIKREMTRQLRSEVIQFLTNHLQNFAWYTEDMPGINTIVVEHFLNINYVCPPIKQKHFQFGEDKQHGMRDEVEKLLKARFIHEVEYPTWLANVIMVKKSNGK